jgi:tetratricopeptide (TPR) repeat protein
MGQKRRGTDKVIHVVFGPGGGRVESKNQRPAGDEIAPPFPSLPDAREPITDLFSGTEVCRLLDLSAGRLRSLDRAGIVSPSGRRHGRRAYTFADLIALRTAQALLNRRVRLRDVARAVTALKRSLPKVTRPLAELRVVSDGQRLVVRSHEGSYEPLTGQMLLDLEIKSLRDDVVRVLRPAAGKERSKTAYSLYVRASQLDEEPATMKEAEALYRQALDLDPWLAIAYTNLGNICFRKGEEADAEKLYQRALQIDTRQPEAQYNLGYLMLERGRPVDAIPHFLGAIEADPKFADAYFNLAMAYEGIGDATNARPCWKHYLELEPAGTWAEIARKHL